MVDKAHAQRSPPLEWLRIRSHKPNPKSMGSLPDCTDGNKAKSTPDTGFCRASSRPSKSEANSTGRRHRDECARTRLRPRLPWEIKSGRSLRQRNTLRAWVRSDCDLGAGFGTAVHERQRTKRACIRIGLPLAGECLPEPWIDCDIGLPSTKSKPLPVPRDHLARHRLPQPRRSVGPGPGCRSPATTVQSPQQQAASGCCTDTTRPTVEYSRCSSHTPECATQASCWCCSSRSAWYWRDAGTAATDRRKQLRRRPRR